MNFRKTTRRLIVSILLLVMSKMAMAQIHVINADSLKLGETAGTNGIAFYGNPYFKNIGLGKLSDSILVRQADGKIKFMPRSLMFSGVGGGSYIQASPSSPQNANIRTNGALSVSAGNSSIGLSSVGNDETGIFYRQFALDPNSMQWYIYRQSDEKYLGFYQFGKQFQFYDDFNENGLMYQKPMNNLQPLSLINKGYADNTYSLISPTGSYIQASPSSPQNANIDITGSIQNGGFYSASGSIGLLSAPIGGTNHPNIAIGDHDTGINWYGDGDIALRGNGNDFIRFSQGSLLYFPVNPRLDVIPTQILTRDATTGEVKYVPSTSLQSSGTGATSVFGRTGAIAAQSGDYSSFYYPLNGNPSGFLTSVPVQSFASLTGKPTTLTGYGITDAYPLNGNPNGFLTSVPAQSFASLTGKPTTLAGYGITDAVPGSRTVNGQSLSGNVNINDISGTSGNTTLWLGQSVNWTDDGVSNINDIITMGNNGVVGRSNQTQVRNFLGLNSLAYSNEDLNRYVQGDNLTRTTGKTSNNVNVALPSGFYDGNSTTGMPNSDWYHLINSRHVNQNVNYQMQLAGQFFSGNEFYLRTIANDVNMGWKRITTDNRLGSNAWESKTNLSQYVNDLGNYGGWLLADGATYAGFASNDINYPYMRYSANNAVVRLLRYDQVGSGAFLNGSVAAAANTVVQRDNNGYIQNSYINTTDDVSPSLGYLIGKNGSDNYHRTYSQATVRAFLGLGANAYESKTNLSQYVNDLGYVTANGSVNYATSSGSANSSTKFMSSSHPDNFYLVNNWDGARWNVTSNHGAPVRVGWADNAGSVDWSNISNKPSNYAVSGGPISQFDNDYGYARAQDITLSTVTLRGSDTPHNLYFYKGASDNVDQGSGISFSSEAGGSPTYSSSWQLGSNGDMVNFGFDGIWQTNLRIYRNGHAWLRGYLSQGSDIRLKKNIKELKSVSENLRAVRAVEYDRVDNEEHQIGFIAQDMQKIFPNLVIENGGEKKMLGIAYSNFTVPLLKGWQEHDVLIAAQQTKIKTLEEELVIQKNELKDLKEELKQLKEFLKVKK
ncbi:tail fiber domain-containing protein [Pedobacter rhodius]|uniref:Tail fiber domain-containing protein n=1 Tax=Pedobacter rhodius TaxID=3004098 RepID=A0ABT4KUC4_9SPHI|nr:tail fiber domain-containing protein [Pedobacter sp. SJ11]MCZ4222522.1 tail fiber domain-containing protein [Pedobacter sp. SJ11]